MSKQCPCCSGKSYQDCCQPIISGAKSAETAEQLMRSRYSAYTIYAISYLLDTTHPSTRKFYKAKEIERWAKSSDWQRLVVTKCLDGKAVDRFGEVEFMAFYLDSSGAMKVHHEHSNFEKIKGQWFYVDGEIVSSI